MALSHVTQEKLKSFLVNACKALEEIQKDQQLTEHENLHDCSVSVDVGPLSGVRYYTIEPSDSFLGTCDKDSFFGVSLSLETDSKRQLTPAITVLRGDMGDYLSQLLGGIGIKFETQNVWEESDDRVGDEFNIPLDAPAKILGKLSQGQSLGNKGA